MFSAVPCGHHLVGGGGRGVCHDMSDRQLRRCMVWIRTRTRQGSEVKERRGKERGQGRVNTVSDGPLPHVLDCQWVLCYLNHWY